MDYIQEDMDAMKNELQMWRHENRQHAEALQKEQRWVSSGSLIYLSRQISGFRRGESFAHFSKQICQSFLWFGEFFLQSELFFEVLKS